MHNYVCMAITCDSLGVHSHLLVSCPAVCHGLHEHINAAGLPRSTGSQHHHAVPHPLSLIQLNQLQGPRGMVDQVGIVDLKVHTNAIYLTVSKDRVISNNTAVCTERRTDSQTYVHQHTYVFRHTPVSQ